MSQFSNNLFALSLINFFTLLSFSNCSLKFNIPNNRDKCFMEEIFMEGTLLIRYDLKGVESIKKEQQEKVLNNIKLFVKDPKGKTIHELYLTDPKGKFALRLDKEGMYTICTKYYKTWKMMELPKEVVLGIKIRTDYENKDLEQSLHAKDVWEFMSKISTLKYQVYPTIHSAKKEIDEEDKMAKAIISTSNLYFTLSLIQIILIFLIAFYQIFNLKKYLSSKNVI